ncbi:MAG: glycosyltransferase family 4 protein [Candidatus Rokubacteria bacterium]|nr:glycosyltransferase family 4 protein [Candidatus Rokubacteria bacterium]
MTRLGVDGRELREGVRTGIGRYLLEVLRAASARGFTAILYGDARTRLPRTLPGVSLSVLPARGTRWWDQVTLPLALGRDRVDVFLSPYYKCPLLAPCPSVLTIHDLFFIGYPGTRRPFRDAVTTRLARAYARRASAIIADSAYSRRAIVERLRVSAAKVHVIPVALGPEFKPEPLTDAVRRRYGIGRPYVLYVGNFRPHKNLPRLLRAYAALPASLGSAHDLVLAGGDRERSGGLEALARDLGVAARVVFPGSIEDADLPALYSGATLFVLPSLEEGFGLPALEAMACGAPVVAGDRAALPEVVGDAALLVDPESEAALRDAMATALSDETLRESLRRRARVRAGEFPAERTAGRVLDLLGEVSAGSA